MRRNLKKLCIGITALILALSVTGCGNNYDAEINALKEEIAELKTELSENKQNGNSSTGITAKSSENTDNTQTAPSDGNTAYTLGAGDYEIPMDVAAGKYDVVCIAGYGIFAVRNPGGGTTIDEIMDIKQEEYTITERKNAILTDGQSINITGSLQVQLIQK